MDVLAQARDLGLVTRHEVTSGLARVRPRSGTGGVSVEVHGRAVARARSVGSSGQLAREGAVMLQLADQDVAPPLLRAEDGWLWTAELPGARVFGDSGAWGESTTLAELTDRCIGLGGALASVHRVPVPLAGGPVAPHPLWWPQPRTAGEASRGWILRELSANPALAGAAASASQGWSHRHWIIGHVDANTILAKSAPYLRVYFVDFRWAGLGSPDWDVAGCVGTIAALAGGGLPSATSASSAEWLAEHFLQSYRRHGGPGHLDPPMLALQALTMAGAAVRAGDNPAVRAWLTRAHGLVNRGRQATEAA